MGLAASTRADSNTIGVWTLLMNATVLPLSIFWTILAILLFPATFIGAKIITRWDGDRIMRQLIWIYARVCLLILVPFVRFKRKGFNRLKITPPVILVANHLSFLDLYCLALLPFGDVSIAVRNWPFKMIWFAPFMHIARYLRVEGNDWRTVSENASDILSRNGSLLFFPEGHRSRDGRLKRFYTGAFKLAVRTGVPILPLCITGTGDILPPGRWWLSPGRMTLKAIEPIDPKTFKAPSAHISLRKFIKTRIKWNLKEMKACSHGGCRVLTPSPAPGPPISGALRSDR